MKKVNIREKLSLIEDQWNPRVVGELNGQHVRLVKIQGEFPFHKHDEEEEMFFVVKGNLRLDFEDRSEHLKEGEFLIVPRGVIHRPYAEEEVELMMFVTNENVNTGDQKNDFTLDTSGLERI